MRKKILQAVVVAFGIWGSAFTVSAMSDSGIESTMLQEQSIETEKPGEGGETSKPETGWIESEEGWQYKDENGNLVKDSWLEIEGERYYFDKDGYRASYWLDINGQYYWLGADGAMRTSWQQIDGAWYYLGNDGVMQTDWIAPGNGYWYYMGSNGAMQTGWISPGDGYWYYADENGGMQTGWIAPGNGYWYYMGSNGAMQTGWISPGDGYWYYADENGGMQTGWILTGENNWYYAYKSGTIAVNTWEKKDGYWYWFDESGLMAQGWKYIGRYKYYFNNSGHLLQDLDGVLGRQSSYEVTINRKRCQVTVYAKDGSNGYIIPAKTFTCSVGLSSTPTPTGTFYTPDKYRWHTLMGPSYGQYCTRINGGILFHSVAGYNMTSYNIRARDYNKLGSPASHGCVRLTVRDAKWIYDNCKLGTKVTISDYAATPFDKPATIKIPASQNWDPTDPNI